MTPIHDRPCVLLVNLGSPDTPETAPTRRYLRQFLSDRRVIETHPVVWRPILEGIILRVRPAKSAEKYRLIWEDWENKAPLVAYTEDQARYAQKHLAGRADVRYAMRYGSHSMRKALDQIYHDGFRRLLVFPLYPQYSASTVGSIADEVYRWGLHSRDQFAFRISRSFQTAEGYIEAMASAIEKRWSEVGRPDFATGDRLILSYHGIPTAMAKGGDPYPLECEETSAALRERLGLPTEYVLHTYQSKFGPAPWLTPATIDTVAELGARGTRRVDVVCPGFVSDCLETLEEIDMENRRAFVDAGGQDFVYISWGNDLQPWLKALSAIVEGDLAGWV